MNLVQNGITELCVRQDLAFFKRRDDVDMSFFLLSVAGEFPGVARAGRVSYFGAFAPHT